MAGSLPELLQAPVGSSILVQCHYRLQDVKARKVWCQVLPEGCQPLVTSTVNRGVPAGSRIFLTDLGGGLLQVEMLALREEDALMADNRAETAVKHTDILRAAVTSDSVFLESALRVRTNLTVLRTEEDALTSTEADLYILGSSPLIVTRMLPEEGWNPSATAFGSFSWTENKAETTGIPAVEITESKLTKGLTFKNVFFRNVLPVTGGRTAVFLDGKPVIAYDDSTVVLGFDLHDSNLPMKYDFPVLIQNILDWLLPSETDERTEAETPMPLAESNVRIVAPDDEPDAAYAQSEKGRELTGILLALFLVLLLAEMGVSRYVG